MRTGHPVRLRAADLEASTRGVCSWRGGPPQPGRHTPHAADFRHRTAAGCRLRTSPPPDCGTCRTCRGLSSHEPVHVARPAVDRRSSGAGVSIIGAGAPYGRDHRWASGHRSGEHLARPCRHALDHPTLSSSGIPSRTSKRAASHPRRPAGRGGIAASEPRVPSPSRRLGPGPSRRRLADGVPFAVGVPPVGLPEPGSQRQRMDEFGQFLGRADFLARLPRPCRV